MANKKTQNANLKGRRPLIRINGEEYKMKNTLRALFIFEKIKGTAFKIETLLDNYLLYYCIILANNPDKPLDWDAFIDALDSDPSLFNEMSTLLKAEEETDKLLSSEEEPEGEEKDSKKN